MAIKWRPRKKIDAHHYALIYHLHNVHVLLTLQDCKLHNYNRRVRGQGWLSAESRLSHLRRGRDRHDVSGTMPET